jgi:hypothetical protein
LWINLNDAKKLADCWGVRKLLVALLDEEISKEDIVPKTELNDSESQ